jgi:hypothetical protein
MKKHMKLCLCMMMIFVLTLAGSMDGLGAEEKRRAQRANRSAVKDRT